MDPLAQAGFQSHFGAFDWALVFFFLFAVTAVGVWSRKFVADMSDYVVAGRAVRAYLGVASIVATEMGLVTVMYSAQQGFQKGFAAFFIAGAAASVAVVVGLTGFIVGPLRMSGAMTIPEFYEQRFGRGVRVVGGAILAFAGILNMGMFLKADSLFITTTVGMTSPGQLKLAMTVMLGMVLLYTMLGGMVAVLITDYLQFVVMAVGLLATTVFLMVRYRWVDLVGVVAQLKGTAGFNPFESGSYGPGYVIWMFFLGLVSCAIWQTAAIRASSAEDLKAVRATYSWGAVGFLIRFMIPYFWGICALAYIAANPALRQVFLPSGGAEVSSEMSLRAMPVALSGLMPPGAIGLLTAAMVAAAMSTYNSYLHVWSAVLSNDVIGPLIGHKLGERAKIHLTQGLMLVIGIFLLVWGLWYPLEEQLWDYMAVTGGIYFTGAFAVLVGGLYWRRASRAGAYAAFCCGLITLLGLKPIQAPLGLDWPQEYVGLAAVSLAVAAMVVFSVLVPKREEVAG